MLAGLQSENRGRLEFTHLEIIWQGAEFKRFLPQPLADLPCGVGCGWVRGHHAPTSGRNRLGLLIWEHFPVLALGWLQDLGRAPYPPKVHNREDFTLRARYLQDEQVSSGTCVPSSNMLYCQRNRAGQGGLVEEGGGGVAGDQ